VTRALQDQETAGHLDREATEMALWTAMHQVGGRLLEQLLNADGGAIAAHGLPAARGITPSSSPFAPKRS
jgi:hypothetical protein